MFTDVCIDCSNTDFIDGGVYGGVQLAGEKGAPAVLGGGVFGFDVRLENGVDGDDGTFRCGVLGVVGDTEHHLRCDPFDECFETIRGDGEHQ